MNSVALVGRLTADPEVRYTQNGQSIANFTIAVDRRFKKEGGPDADFPRINAFGKTAEFIEKYFSKGMRIGITGRIQTGSYTDKDGRKVYTTDVVAESVEFVERKADGPTDQNKTGRVDENGFEDIPEGIDEELPFT